MSSYIKLVFILTPAIAIAVRPRKGQGNWCKRLRASHRGTGETLSAWNILDITRYQTATGADFCHGNSGISAWIKNANPWDSWWLWEWRICCGPLGQQDKMHKSWKLNIQPPEKCGKTQLAPSVWGCLGAGSSKVLQFFTLWTSTSMRWPVASENEELGYMYYMSPKGVFNKNYRNRAVF